VREIRNHNGLLRLADAYYQISDIPIDVQRIGKNGIFGGGNLDGVAQDLAKVVGQLGEWEASQIAIDTDDKLQVRRLPSSRKGYRRWEWVSGHVGFSKPIDEQMLKAAVNPKYDKLKGYRRSVKRVMLLVYADRTWNSGMVHRDNRPLTVGVRGFEEIYLYLHPEWAVRLSMV